jgi:hypothetical protein
LMRIAKALSGEIVSVGMRGSIRARAIGVHESVCQIHSPAIAELPTACGWAPQS